MQFENSLFRFLGALTRSREDDEAPLRGRLSSSSCLLRISERARASFDSPSYKEPTVDALAPEADEGRGWLRKATGSCRPSFDPWISEWGNPTPVMGCDSRLNKIGRVEGTG